MDAICTCKTHLLGNTIRLFGIEVFVSWSPHERSLYNLFENFRHSGGGAGRAFSVTKDDLPSTGDCGTGDGQLDEAGCTAGKRRRTSAKIPETTEGNNQPSSRSDFDPEQCGPKTLAMRIERQRSRYRLFVGTVEYEIQSG